MTDALKDSLRIQIDAALAGYAVATPENGCVHGYNILRWFLQGHIGHPNETTQNDLMLFQFARDFEGNHIQENSWKGYEILRAAKRGELIRIL